MTLIANYRSLLSGKKSWILRAGGVGATVDLDFVNNRGWNSGATSIASFLTCSRASTGYYTTSSGILTSFANNVLRTGTNGLLVEESRTNLALQSNTFSATWAPTNIFDSSFATTTTGPDGISTSGQKLTENTTNGQHKINQNFTKAASALPYTATLFAKQSDRTRVQIDFDDNSGNGGFACYDLAGGQIGVAAATYGVGFSAASATITAVSNGWYKCTFTATTNSATTLGLYIILDNASGVAASSSTYAGTNGQGVYIYGAQLEQAATGSSYIPTTGSTATRAADVVSFTRASTSLSGTTETAYAKFNLPGNTANQALIGSSDATNEFLTTDTNSKLGTYQGVLLETANTYSAATTAKGAAAWDGTGRSLCLSAGTVATDANVYSASTSYFIGSYNNGASQFANGLIKRVAWWTTKLSNANLQAITT